jgi:hypothetical protein
MKKFNIIISLLISLFIITACGSGISTETRPAGESDGPGPRPTPTIEILSTEPVELPVPYPGNPPTVEPFPGDYPAPQELPTIDPYPANANTVWVLHPVGEQCEDASAGKYTGTQDAKAGLTAAGLTVHDISTTDLMVCTACGCPTSTHYRAEINETDLDKAVSLGWEPEQ